MSVPTSFKSREWFIRLKSRIDAFKRGVAYQHRTRSLMPRLPEDGWTEDQFANHINQTEGFGGKEGCLPAHVTTTAKEMGYVIRPDVFTEQPRVFPPK